MVKFFRQLYWIIKWGVHYRSRSLVERTAAPLVERQKRPQNSQPSTLNSQPSGYTGAGAARAVLGFAGVQGVLVTANTTGHNHYDPRLRIIYLSLPTYYRSTIESVAIGAHEAGHAIQHARRVNAFMFRLAVLPHARVLTFASSICLLIGVLTHWHWLIVAVVSAYAILTIFHLLMIPLEINASNRAHGILIATGLITFGSEESKFVQRFYVRCLWSYIFAFATAPFYLIASLIHKRRR